MSVSYREQKITNNYNKGTDRLCYCDHFMLTTRFLEYITASFFIFLNSHYFAVFFFASMVRCRRPFIIWSLVCWQNIVTSIFKGKTEVLCAFSLCVCRVVNMMNYVVLVLARNSVTVIRNQERSAAAYDSSRAFRKFVFRYPWTQIPNNWPRSVHNNTVLYTPRAIPTARPVSDRRLRRDGSSREQFCVFLSTGKAYSKTLLYNTFVTSGLRGSTWGLDDRRVKSCIIQSQFQEKTPWHSLFDYMSCYLSGPHPK